MSFAQDLLARNNPAVRVSDPLAGEIDENFKAHLVRLLKLCGGDDGELGLALLHGQHRQVGGPDNPKINITFGLKADISKPQAHCEIRRRRSGMVRTDLAPELSTILMLDVAIR